MPLRSRALRNRTSSSAVRRQENGNGAKSLAAGTLHDASKASE
jgi:hypothetical protein